MLSRLPLRAGAFVTMALLTLTLGAPAKASGPDGLSAEAGFLQDVIRQAMTDCMGDAFRLCPGTPPGGGRIAACLASRREQASPICRAHIDKAAAAREAQATCAGDVARFCPGVPAGGGRVVACLYGSRDRLSKACRSSLEQATSRLQH